MNIFRELYEYREMIYMLVQREIRGRYKGSALGFFWTFLNPLLQFVVYAVVFSTIMRVDIDQFYIYLFVAFIPWFFLATAIPQGATCILGQSNLVEKIYFPRMVIPISTVLTGFVNMLLSEVVVLLVLLVSGFGISYHIAALPIVMMIQLLFLMGIVLVISALTVYFRDLAHILDIVVMGWFYATPIVYPPDMVPQNLQFLLYLNPMSGIIKCYRQILYYKCWPDFSSMVLALIVGAVMLLVGIFVFQKFQRGFAEEM